MNGQLKLIAEYLGIIFGVAVLMILYMRIMAQGKIRCLFDDNKRSYTKMLKEDKAENCVWLGKADSENREKYIIDQTKISLTAWPEGLPGIFQTDVRTLKFIRGQTAPYDAKGPSKIVTAIYMRLVTDVKMLQAKYREVSAALGIKGGKLAGRFELYILMGVVIAVILALYSIYMNYQTVGVLKAIYGTLHGVPTPPGK